MGTKGACFAALVALAFAAGPARAESEGNGPAGNDGVFASWVVPLAAGAGSATSANADGYAARPSFGVAMSGATPAGAASGGEGGYHAWPALPLGGAGAGTAHARAPARGAPRG